MTPAPAKTPLVTPDEAIAIALTAFPRPAIVDPGSAIVKVVRRLIDEAGWKIVPKEGDER